jgi:hypothetical protein
MAHAASAFNEVNRCTPRLVAADRALDYRQRVGPITQTPNANFAARLKCG